MLRALLNAPFLAVRFKVAVLLTVVGFVLVMFSGAFVFHIYSTQIDERSHLRAEVFADVLVHAASQAGSFQELNAALAALVLNSGLDLAVIADQEGKIVAASQANLRGLPVSSLTIPQAAERFDAASGDLSRAESPGHEFTDFTRYVALPFAGEEGMLFIRLEATTVRDGLQTTAWSILMWLVAAVIVAVMTISLVMQKILVAPVETLRSFAELGRRTRYHTPKGPRDELSLVAEVLEDLFEAKSLSEARLIDLAQTDGLTGIGNRSFFKMRLDEEIRRAARLGENIGVMILNLDSFKDVNDTLGHDVGDIILKRTAEILKNCQRKGDTVARLGADEFGVILSGITAAEGSVEFANRFVRAVGAPFRIGSQELHQTACVGLTLYPQDGRDPDVLIKNADIALSRAKLEGSGACTLYRHELHLRVMERNSIERDLRAALAQKQFVLYYQPKIDIHSGRICGSEALIRWMHPERGLVPPDLFIPVAERCGLIADVTRWVLDEACRQNVAWQVAGLPKIGVAVNVSAVDLRRPDLTDIVANTLVGRGLSPQYLELEVTESMVMRDVDVVIGTLRRLRGLGIGIGIDDFGTGYSSLAYLKRFPVKRLKIDRSFVRDIADGREGAIIPKVIIDLAHALGIGVLAEGVEDFAQLEILRSLGCDEAQGYFLGRPMPAAEFEVFLMQAVDGMHPDLAMRASTPRFAVPDEKRPRTAPGSAA